MKNKTILLINSTRVYFIYTAAISLYIFLLE